MINTFITTATVALLTTLIFGVALTTISLTGIVGEIAIFLLTKILIATTAISIFGFFGAIVIMEFNVTNSIRIERRKS